MNLRTKNLSLISVCIFLLHLPLCSSLADTAPLLYNSQSTEYMEAGKFSAVDTDDTRGLLQFRVVPGTIYAQNFQNFAMALSFDGMQYFFPTTANSFGCSVVPSGQDSLGFNASLYCDLLSSITYISVNYLMISHAYPGYVSQDLIVIVEQINLGADVPEGTPYVVNASDSRIKIGASSFYAMMGISEFQAYSHTRATNNQIKIDLQLRIEMASSTYEVTLNSKNNRIGTVVFYVLLFTSDFYDQQSTQFVSRFAAFDTDRVSVGNNHVTLSSLSKIDFVSGNYFMGLSGFDAIDSLRFEFYHNNGDLLLNSTGTLAAINSNCWLIYSIYCPDYYFFEENSTNTLCQRCPMTHCQQCNITHCQTCTPNANFTLSADETQCECVAPLEAKTGVCYEPTELPGCLTVFVDSSDSLAKCSYCSETLNLEATSDGYCDCKRGYEFATGSTVYQCSEKCGDAIIVGTEECDDGNTDTNDGCDSSCLLEADFTCDSPSGTTVCKSDAQLSFKAESIMKHSKENSATLTFATTSEDLPFGFSLSQFTSDDENASQMFSISVLIDGVYQELDSRLISAETSTLTFEIDYPLTIESFDALWSLNLTRSKYTVSQAQLSFEAKGTNSPLLYSSYLENYALISNAMLGVNIVLILMMLVGLIAPKFIGLEAVLILQLIFYCQSLVHQPERWPVGFLYFEYFKYATGFNHGWVQHSSYSLDSASTVKMNHLQMSKLIYENFNTSFVLLVAAVLGLVITVLWRVYREDSLMQYRKQENYEKQTMKNLKDSFVFSLRLNQKAFMVLFQISLWCLLPLISTLTAFATIQNSLVTVLVENPIFTRMSGVCLQIAFITVIAVGINTFFNTMLSELSVGKLMERPQQMKYKKYTFLHLLMMGIVIFIGGGFSQSDDQIPISIIALAIELCYFVVLIRLSPYSQSLHIHKWCMLIGHGLLLIFLAYLNLVNFLSEGLDEVIDLALGFLILVCSVGLIVLTGFRLYYEYRYGEELEKRICAERQAQVKRQEKLEREEFEMKRMLYQQEAKHRANQVTASQRQRQQNPYLIENQIKEDQMISLLEWLETRTIWSQERKEEYYFRHFTQKPMKWLKVHDQPEYERKLKLEIQRLESIKLKKEETSSNQEYQRLKRRLKRELKQKRKQLVFQR